MTHPHPEGGARLTATATIKAHPAAFRLHQLADHLRRYAYRYSEEVQLHGVLENEHLGRRWVSVDRVMDYLRAGGESFRRFSGYDMQDAVTAWPRVAA